MASISIDISFMCLADGSKISAAVWVTLFCLFYVIIRYKQHIILIRQFQNFTHLQILTKKN